MAALSKTRHNKKKEHKDFEINLKSTEESAVCEVNITCKRYMKKYALGKVEGGGLHCFKLD